MKKIVKSKGVMVSSIVSLLLSLVVLATVSMAWLSMNKDTTSNGMQLKVEVTPNLIINTSSTNIVNVGGPTESDFRVDFSSPETASVKPATHDGAVGAVSWTYSTGLKYVTNPENVDPSTGLAKSGDLTFAEASTTDYYVDFTVYIASAGVELTSHDLKAKLLPEASIAGSGANKKDTLDATTIDFYVGSVSSANYKGTLNVAGLDASANNYTTEKDELLLISSGTIPYNKASTGDKYITIIMRCYIDGALKKDATHTYINTEKVDVNKITLNVTFTATDRSGS